MPATSTIPEELKLLLAHFKTDLVKLSRHTGISRARLLALFQAGDFSRAELLRFVELLSPAFARAFIAGTQTGNFNQAGTANQQKIVNKTYNVVINVNGVAEPNTKAAGRLPQQWDSYQVLPGGQAEQIGQASPCRGPG